jgi:hypothetical protein
VWSSILRHDLKVRARWAATATAMLTLAAVLAGGTGAPPALADRTGTAGGSWEVLGAACSLPTFSQPTDVTVDARGNVYVVDSGNRRIVKLSPRGQVVAQLGQGSASGTGRSIIPASVALDRRGNLYVGDAVHQLLARFLPGGRQLAQWRRQEASMENLVRADGASHRPDLRRTSRHPET